MVSKRLQDLIVENGHLHLPGIGSLVVESLPAAFKEDGKTILPPSKRLVFNANKEAVEGDDSIVELSNAIVERLESGESFIIPGFGNFEKSGEDIQFSVDEKFDFAPDNFSLEEISLEINEEIATEPQPEEKTGRGAPVMAEPKKRGASGWIWGVVAVLGLLILLVLLLMIFKEDLRPLLQNLLYSKEELEIMQKWAAQ